MQTKEYIEATYETISKGKNIDTVLASLLRVLKNHGLEKHYSLILKGVIEKIQRISRTQSLKVIVAREKDFIRHKSEIQKVLSELPNKEEGFEKHIDESIIGGFIVTGQGLRVDRSNKSTLLHIYHKVLD